MVVTGHVFIQAFLPWGASRESTARTGADEWRVVNELKYEITSTHLDGVPKDSKPLLPQTSIQCKLVVSIQSCSYINIPSRDHCACPLWGVSL